MLVVTTAIATALVTGCSISVPQEPEARYGPNKGSSVAPERQQHKGPRLGVQVFYRSGSRLVAADARVPVRGNPIVSALELAAEPTHSDLQAAVPSGAFAQAGFDGIGRTGSFWVEVADDRWIGAQPQLSAADARLAVRAVVCTVQSLGNGRSRVDVFRVGGGSPAQRLFGQPLPRAKGRVLDVGCPR